MAFGATGEYETASYGNPPGVVVNLLADAVTLAETTMVTRTGVAIRPVHDALTFQEKTLNPWNGKRIVPPIDTLSENQKLPMVSAGWRIVAPKDAVLAASDKTPRIATGWAVRPAADALTSTFKTFNAWNGKRMDLPKDLPVEVDKLPRISSGVSEFLPSDLPSDNLQQSFPLPRISGGWRVAAPAATMSGTFGQQNVWTGKNPILPRDSETMTGKLPAPWNGKRIDLPRTDLAAADKTPRFATGVFIEIDRTFIGTYTIGTTGGSATAEDATGAETSTTRTIRVPDGLGQQPMQMNVWTGKNPKLPADASLHQTYSSVLFSISAIVRLQPDNWAEGFKILRPSAGVFAIMPHEQFTQAFKTLSPRAGANPKLPLDAHTVTYDTLEFGARRKKLRVKTIIC